MAIKNLDTDENDSVDGVYKIVGSKVQITIEKGGFEQSLICNFYDDYIEITSVDVDDFPKITLYKKS